MILVAQTVFQWVLTCGDDALLLASVYLLWERWKYAASGVRWGGIIAWGSGQLYSHRSLKGHCMGEGYQTRLVIFSGAFHLQFLHTVVWLKCSNVDHYLVAPLRQFHQEGVHRYGAIVARLQYNQALQFSGRYFSELDAVHFQFCRITVE